MSRKKLKIGVSACLLGIKCRYDGKAKGDPRIYELLKDKVDLIPICPEFNCGLGIPRPPMRLEASPKGTRMKVIETGEDKTEVMRDWINVELKLLERIDIAAFILPRQMRAWALCRRPRAEIPVDDRLRGGRFPRSRGKAGDRRSSRTGTEMTPGCRTDWISNLFLNEGVPYVVVRHLRNMRECRTVV